jgi:hypothetical protein
MIAEVLCMVRSGGEAEIVLQWGRDQMIAEIRSDTDHRNPQLHASTGPRSDDRGNHTST